MAEQLQLPFYPYKIQKRKLKQYWRDAMQRVGSSCAEEAVRKLYDSGRSIRQTADVLGFSYTTIHTILKATGAEIRHPGGNNNPYGRKGRPDKPHWS